MNGRWLVNGKIWHSVDSCSTIRHARKCVDELPRILVVSSIWKLCLWLREPMASAREVLFDQRLEILGWLSLIERLKI